MTRGRGRRVWIAAGVAGGLLAIGAGWLWLSRQRLERRSVAVRRGPLEKVLQRRGTLRPAKEIVVCAPFGGFLTHVVPSGTSVKAGDTLFQVDSTRLEDTRRSRAAWLARGKAELARIEANGAKERMAAGNDLERCRLRLELERLRLEELRKGPKPEDELSAKTNLQAAENILKARREEMEILTSLAGMGFVSGEEVRTKRLQVQEAQVESERAEIAWNQLKAGPVASRIEEQSLKVREAERAAENAAARIESLKRSGEVETARAAKRAASQEKSLREAVEKLAKARTTAPADGTALVRLRWGAPWTAGRQVWEGVDVVSIPTLKRMKAVVRVDEGKIGQVREGQPARVRVMAFHHRELAGKVAKVAALGRDEFEAFLRETRDRTGEAMRKAYDVEIEMEDADLPLAANMTVEVEIVLASVADSFLVPRVAVRELGDGTKCVEVLGRFGAERRPVRVEAATGTRCAVVEGLSEGERVLLPEGGPW